LIQEDTDAELFRHRELSVNVPGLLPNTLLFLLLVFSANKEFVLGHNLTLFSVSSLETFKSLLIRRSQFLELLTWGLI
jgi:hypothetical protein